MEFHNGMKFSTYDKDQDANSSVHCAREMHGAWWYNDCKDTSTSPNYKSNLNGAYDKFWTLDSKTAFSWYGGKYRLWYSAIMVRRK